MIKIVFDDLLTNFSIEETEKGENPLAHATSPTRNLGKLINITSQFAAGLLDSGLGRNIGEVINVLCMLAVVDLLLDLV